MGSPDEGILYTLISGRSVLSVTLKGFILIVVMINKFICITNKIELLVSFKKDNLSYIFTQKLKNLEVNLRFLYLSTNPFGDFE